jgi:hypothetical protein
MAKGSRHKPLWSSGGDGEKTSTGNASADGEEGGITRRARQKIGDGPVFKRWK